MLKAKIKDGQSNLSGYRNEFDERKAFLLILAVNQALNEDSSSLAAEMQEQALGYIPPVFGFIEIDIDQTFQKGLFSKTRMNRTYSLSDEIVFLDYPFLDLREDDYQVFGLVPQAHPEHLLEQCLQLEADKLKTREIFSLYLQPVNQKAGNRLEKFRAILFLRYLLGEN